MSDTFRWVIAKPQAAVIILLVICAANAAGEAIWIDDDANDRETIRMEVTPADEPSPAFKYRLTLLPHQKVPGNSVAHYMRAFPEWGIEKTWSRVREKYGEAVDEWYSTDFSMSALPLDKVREAAGFFRELVDNYMRPGSKCRDTDWGVSYVDIRGPEVISFLLPEIQSMRSIARAMSLVTRVAIADGRYDDAIDLMRINYRLGRDVGKQPILVSNLVGIAICGVANANAVDLIAAPDSPNLYWALSELPRPQVSMREAMRLELAIGPRMFEILDSPETEQRTDAEWNALWMREARIVDEADLWNETRPPVEPLGEEAAAQRNVALIRDFMPAVYGLIGYSHAKRRLVAWGYAADKVEAMAVGQVLAIYSARVYTIIADNQEKSLYVDYPGGKSVRQAAYDRFDQMRMGGDDPDREIIPIASLLLPATQAAAAAGVRSERDLDALRVIEALRIHAARNEGQWPKSLADVTCVPVPNNVATDEPFEYELVGDTAVLVLPLSDGFYQEKRFELTIAK